jgi:hypothetical protein
MNSLVITSLNPKSRFRYQFSCFNRWKELGYKTLTFNSQDEVDLLKRKGVIPEDIFCIDTCETGLELFSKSIPRIYPVLQKALALNYESYFLVNSDIYPAHRKIVSTFLNKISDTIALTRNECFSLFSSNFHVNTPYRGGLDVFYFSKVGLSSTLNILKEVDVSRRLMFGMPGWDFYLGHVLLENGGKVMDGSVFLHKSHRPSYNSIDEFKHYAIEIFKNKKCISEFGALEASDFSKLIESNCIQNSFFSKKLQSIYYAKPDTTANKFPSDIPDRILLKVNALIERVGLEIYRPNNLISFINSQVCDGISWSAAETFWKEGLTNLSLIQAGVLILNIQLIAKKELQNLNISNRYGSESAHGVVVEGIASRSCDETRCMELFNLFSLELVDHSTFNQNLFKYIVYSFESTQSLMLCKNLISIVTESFTNAT